MVVKIINEYMDHLGLTLILCTENTIGEYVVVVVEHLERTIGESVVVVVEHFI